MVYGPRQIGKLRDTVQASHRPSGVNPAGHASLSSLFSEDGAFKILICAKENMKMKIRDPE